MKYLFGLICLLTLTACGNPGDISDSEYAAFKDLRAPKLLYSCTIDGREGAKLKAGFECLKQVGSEHDACVDEKLKSYKPLVNVGYVAGVGAAVTYNKLLGDAKKECKGSFSVLESAS